MRVDLEEHSPALASPDFTVFVMKPSTCGWMSVERRDRSSINSLVVPPVSA
jgi:hypothetical protein